ncbi:hypothetical protein ABK040_006857 [Willaertia magna]
MFFNKSKNTYFQFLPDEIICHILGYISVPKDNLLKSFVKTINNLYLVNKQFNELTKYLFDNTFYKDLLLSTFLRHVSSELQQKIIEINDYKTIYSFLNCYYNLKIKQLKEQKLIYNYNNNLYYNKERDIYEMKMAVVGDGGVGKSTITVRYVQNIFVEEYDPTIEDSYRKQIVVDEKRFFLDVLDTAGQDEFRALRDQYYRSANCILSVCDLTNRRTLDEVENTIETFYRVKDADNLPIVIIGNKLDLIEQENQTREITKEMVDEVIKKVCSYSTLKPIYIETSAKTGYNIDDAFCEAVRLSQCTYVDWNDVIKRLLNGEKLFKEFESTKSQKCIVM